MVFLFICFIVICFGIFGEHDLTYTELILSGSFSTSGLSDIASVLILGSNESGSQEEEFSSTELTMSIPYGVFGNISSN